MNKEEIKTIRPADASNMIINNIPRDRIQDSMPKAINVPPPPKPKK